MCVGFDCLICLFVINYVMFVNDRSLCGGCCTLSWISYCQESFYMWAVRQGFSSGTELATPQKRAQSALEAQEKDRSGGAEGVHLPPKSVVRAHHDPARALGDLTGIKKHFARKHGEKKFGCTRCHKRYAVLYLKAHSKICGTKEYKCECGTTFYV